MKTKPTVSKEFQALKNTIEKQLVNKLCSKPGGGPHLFGKVTQNNTTSTTNGKTTNSLSPSPNPHVTKNGGGGDGCLGTAKKAAGKLGSLDSLGNNINSSELSSQMSSFSTSSLEQQQHEQQRLANTGNHGNNTKKPPMSVGIGGGGSSGCQSPAGRPKPKLIDLEFRNELEKLFASSSSNNRAANRALSSSRLNSESPLNVQATVSAAAAAATILANKTVPNTPTPIEQSASGPELIGSRRLFKSSDQILDSSPLGGSGMGDTFEQKKMILDSLMQSRLARMNSMRENESTMILAGSSNGLVPPPPTPTHHLVASASTSSVPPAPPLPPPTPPPPPPPPMPPLLSSSPGLFGQQQQQQPVQGMFVYFKGC